MISRRKEEATPKIERANEKIMDMRNQYRSRNRCTYSGPGLDILEAQLKRVVTLLRSTENSIY